MNKARFNSMMFDPLREQWKRGSAFQHLWIPLLVLLLVGVGLRTARAETRTSGAARVALELCSRADEATANQKRELLREGLRLAEAAVDANTLDPQAHFAVFCNLGKQMQLSGLSFSSLFTLRRLSRELDATLALAPDDADALAAKGAFLLELPRFLGGDPEEAERVLRHALAVDPQHRRAREILNSIESSRGTPDPAVQVGARQSSGQ